MATAPFNGTYPAPDTAAPTAPGTPVITNALENGTATVTVAASTDAVGVIGYAAFLNGAVNEVGRSNTTIINLSGIPAGTHSISVRAFDARGNYSAGSSAGFSIPEKAYAGTETITPRTSIAELSNSGAERIGKRMFLEGAEAGGKSKRSAIDKVFAHAGASTYANRTWVEQRDAMGGFFGIQIILENYDTAAVQPILAATACAIPTNGHSGLGMSFVPITFNGLTTGEIPAATDSGTVRPIPGQLVSDIIYLESIPRTDVLDANPLVHIRVRNGATIWRMISINPNGTGVFNTSTGREIKNTSGATDGTTNATTVAYVPTDTSSGIFVAIPTIKFFYKKNAVDVAICGDSTYAGLQGDAGVSNVTAQVLGGLSFASLGAKLASNKNRNVTAWNCAQASRTQTEYYNNTVNYVIAQKPSFLLWQTWSINNVKGSIPAFNLGKQQTLNIINKCCDNNIQIILGTQPLNSYLTAGEQAMAASYNDFIKSLGLPVFDIATYISNPNGVGIKAIYDQDNNTHWNLDCTTYLGGLFADFINKL